MSEALSLMLLFSWLLIFIVVESGLAAVMAYFCLVHTATGVTLKMQWQFLSAFIREMVTF